MQAREYRINWEIYTLYAGAAGMLLLRNKLVNFVPIILSTQIKSKLFNQGSYAY